MKLGHIDFGPIWAASGTRGFFGEGYWFHKLIPSLEATTFVAKTTTLRSNPGNMKLDATTWQPKEWFPNCIRTDFWRGSAINAVGLSNFGIDAALATNRWQQMTQPFMLSFMPLSKDKEGKLAETREYVKQLKPRLKFFASPIALQVNLSCPNTGENLAELAHEAVEIILILKELGIPLVPKFNVMTSPETVKHIYEETGIAGVCISNTIPYGQHDSIAWEKEFGSVSPLQKLGGGGLSGSSLLPIVTRWVRSARKKGLHIPINAGGGIMSKHDVDEMFMAGADSISIGTVAMLRPWRIPSIIKAAQAAYDN